MSILSNPCIDNEYILSPHSQIITIAISRADRAQMSEMSSSAASGQFVQRYEEIAGQVVIDNVRQSLAARMSTHCSAETYYSTNYHNIINHNITAF